MSELRLLNVSSMYSGSLDRFYNMNPEIIKESYTSHCEILLADSTEFAASYTKFFRLNGFEASAIIVNDNLLQNKWLNENKTYKGKINIVFSQILKASPDILWIEDFRYISADLLDKIRTEVSSIKLIIAYHCAPWNSMILQKLKKCDFVITCTPGLKQELETEGAKAYLVYHGFDDEIFMRMNAAPETKTIDVLFSGSISQGIGYHSERLELISHLLERGINLSLYLNLESNRKISLRIILFHLNSLLKVIGINKPEKYFKLFESGKSRAEYYPANILKTVNKPEYGTDMYRLIQNSRIVLNNHGEVAGDYAGNMRLFEATGAGSCLLTDNKSNLKDLFDIGNELVVYHDPEECAEKILWLLKNEEVRKNIAIAGQKRTLRCHTVDMRCKEIIEIINKELSLK